ncbi:hypothetical protein F4805DRAFT_419930 [Annulohypoxylon moriforme]|nr:hypothetical protein F4805DRAFT_419930 [Annulohypoxylon moriforme]
MTLKITCWFTLTVSLARSLDLSKRASTKCSVPQPKNLRQKIAEGWVDGRYPKDTKSCKEVLEEVKSTAIGVTPEPSKVPGYASKVRSDLDEN